MKNFKIFAFVYVLSVLPLQGQKVTKEDYNRAVSFNYGNLVNETVFNLKTDVFWFKNNCSSESINVDGLKKVV